MHQGFRELLSRPWASPSENRVHMDAPDASDVVASALYRYGSQFSPRVDSVVLVCIGSDRSIGDALGPLVGSLVSEGPREGFSVLGTLDNPVHAGNLEDTLQWIHVTYRSPLVVAVDACLGRVESVGNLTVGCGSLKPGAGVNKSLPAVGRIYVTGVVNVGGFMEYFVLQNTRLSMVMRMARVLARGIGNGLNTLMASSNVACGVRRT